MSVADTLIARKAVHGDFSDHALIVQEFKSIAHKAPSWPRMDAVQREAVDMILHKVGRTLAGNPSHHDHWLDIAGYSMLVANGLEGESERLFSIRPEGEGRGE